MSKAVTLEDLVAYLPQHVYIYLPTREPWPAESVNSQLPKMALLDDDGNPVLDKKGKPIEISASAWLDRQRPVLQMTWAPGHDMIIRDKLVAEGGWIEKPEAKCLNLYRPPMLQLGRASKRKAKPWLDHIYHIYPDDADWIIKWLAHRVQRPHDKINHALMLGGAQGIGKDTLLEPVKHAVGPWNFIEVSPGHLMGNFNGFVRSVVLRVSETRDLGDITRFEFYEHTKPYAASPPDVLRCNEKHLREHSVLNCCGLVITTNYKTEGIYLPADDRRHYVAWSDLKKENFTKKYWNDFWRWYRKKGGIQAVASYLAALDIRRFDANAPPPKTPAFWAIVDANRAPEESELTDALERLGFPAAVTLQQVIDCVKTHNPFSHYGGERGTFCEWLKDRRNRRIIPHRFEQVGYEPIRNPARDTGMWVVGNVRQAIYAKKELEPRDQLAAAQHLARTAGAKPAGKIVASKVTTIKKVKPTTRNSGAARRF